MKAEFIDGEIIVHSPVVKMHNDISINISSILNIYNLTHKLGFLGVEKIMCRFPRNDYEPDFCFFLSANHPDFRSDQTIFPVPDFIIEILSKSTEDRDRGVKFQDYQMHGVIEYWIIDPDAETIEQYVNKDDQFQLISKSSDAVIKSVVFEGLAIPNKAFFDGKASFDFIKTL
jgi:Uma2 family endonuclease